MQICMFLIREGQLKSDRPPLSTPALAISFHCSSPLFQQNVQSHRPDPIQWYHWASSPNLAIRSMTANAKLSLRDGGWVKSRRSYRVLPHFAFMVGAKPRWSCPIKPWTEPVAEYIVNQLVNKELHWGPRVHMPHMPLTKIPWLRVTSQGQLLTTCFGTWISTAFDKWNVKLPS